MDNNYSLRHYYYSVTVPSKPFALLILLELEGLENPNKGFAYHGEFEPVTLTLGFLSIHLQTDKAIIYTLWKPDNKVTVDFKNRDTLELFDAILRSSKFKLKQDFKSTRS